MVLVLLACASTPEPPPADTPSAVPTAVVTVAAPAAEEPPPTPEAPPGTPVPGSLPPGMGGVKSPPPCKGLDPTLWRLVTDPAPVRVSIDLAGEIVLPPSFVEEARGPGVVQGTLPGADLCLLGAQEHVQRVRKPVEAHPK